MQASLLCKQAESDKEWGSEMRFNCCPNQVVPIVEPLKPGDVIKLTADLSSHYADLKAGDVCIVGGWFHVPDRATYFIRLRDGRVFGNFGELSLITTPHIKTGFTCTLTEG